MVFNELPFDTVEPATPLLDDGGESEGDFG